MPSPFQWYFAGFVVILATAISGWSAPTGTGLRLPHAPLTEVPIAAEHQVQLHPVPQQEIAATQLSRQKLEAHYPLNNDNVAEFGSTEQTQGIHEEVLDNYVRTNNIEKLRSLVADNLINKDQVISRAINTKQHDVFKTFAPDDSGEQLLKNAQKFDDLRSLIRLQWTQGKVIEEAIKSYNVELLSSLADPIFNQEQLAQAVGSHNWDKIRKINLVQVNVAHAVDEAAKEGQDDAVSQMLYYGTFDVEDILRTAKALKDDTNEVVKTLKRKSDKIVSNLLRDNNADKLRTLVNEKLIDHDDLIERALKNNFRNVLTSLADAADQEKYAKAVRDGDLGKISKMNLIRVNVAGELEKVAKL